MKHPMILKLLLGFTLIMAGAQAPAITITPDDCTAAFPCWSGIDPVNPKASDVSSITGISGLDLIELYKSDVDSGEETNDPFSTSYETTYSNSTTDPANALITYVDGNSISCPECYLLVKDGNNNPRWYLFDIGFWNGTDELRMEDFWAERGAISHVAIFGDSSQVPEPGTLALLSLGLLGMALGRKRLV